MMRTENIKDIIGNSLSDLYDKAFNDGVEATVKAIIKQIEIVIGAMILDGYEEEDSCIKYLKELIIELNNDTKKGKNT